MNRNRGRSIGVNNLQINYNEIITKISEMNKTISIILDRLNKLEQRQDKLEKKLMEISNNQIKNNNLLKDNDWVDEIANYYKDKKTINFIKYYRIEEIGNEYFSPSEINGQNEEINSLIGEKAINDFLPNQEVYKNESVGNFFYSIGGISRISQKLANKLYYQLYEEYKKYLFNNKKSLSFSPENDRKNLSIWIKKCLSDNIYEYFAIINFKEIKIYLGKKDENINKFFYNIFKQLISLYLKCRLSFPIIECRYTRNNCEFDPHTMVDLILKGGKNKKVNFCYLPALISNGKMLRNSKYLVFNYIKGETFQKERNLYENMEVEQNPQLYTLPNFEAFKIELNMLELIVSPKISPDLNPQYILFINDNKNYKVSENGIFKLNQNDLKSQVSIKIIYCNQYEFNTNWFNFNNQIK